MLAADVGVATQAVADAQPGGEFQADVASQTARLSIRASDSDQAFHCESARSLVIIDPSVAADFDFSNVIPPGADLAILDADRDPIEQISEILQSRSDLRDLHLISHGNAGQLRLGNQVVDQAMLRSRTVELANWKQAFSDHGDLLIYGCDVASTDGGREFVNEFAKQTGLDTAASTDLTGNRNRNADWDLEYLVGQIENPRAFDTAALAQFSGTLLVEIYAAGDLGDEVMELQIGDQIVGSWNMSGTDADARQFGRFTVDNSNLSVDDIRINFVNDLWNPSAGIDRNLLVDRIVVDGVTYQSEHPAIYSTGTWMPSDGVTPGFRQSEYLNANGYFQYSHQAASNGTTIEIEASGSTGQESMQLLIDGNVVRSFEGVSTNESTYVYQTAQPVSADRVRVAFVNDLYNAQQGIDRNLTVDKIRVNGQAFETEAATTFSTGFYSSGQGVQSGFFQNDTLFVNGYFQYLADNSDPPSGGESGSFVLAEDFASVFENGSSVTMRIDRVGGSEGVASVSYSTASETATAGSDFVAESGTLVFASGETSKTVTVSVLQDGVAEGHRVV